MPSPQINLLRALVILLISLVFFTPLFAETPKLESLFPEDNQDKEVERRKLSDADRQQRLKDGISEEVLDIYGDVLVGSGYGSKGYTWGQAPLNDLGSKKITYDTKGMRKLAPPKAGEFPRMFFVDSDRQEQLERLENTQAGQKAKKLMECMVAMLKGYWEEDAEYNKPDVLKGDWHTHGYLPMQRLGDRTGKAWKAYIKGEVPFQKDKDGNIEKDKNGKEKKVHLPLGKLAFEAFRCWVYDDKEAARTAIDAYLLYINTFDHSGWAITLSPRRAILMAISPPRVFLPMPSKQGPAWNQP
jgi:hypothetical protein